MGTVVGITGGIATGKSTVAAMFRELGAESLDADEVARRVTLPGSEVVDQIRRRFGPDVVSRDGSLDRARLADIVFADAAAREDLNRLTHPLIIDLLKEGIRQFKQDHPCDCDVLVVEIPLLVEANIPGIVDKIVLVSAEQETQQNRLGKRSNLSEEQISQRIGSQMPLSEKIPYADWVVTTDCSMEETNSQVQRVWHAIRTFCRDSG